MDVLTRMNVSRKKPLFSAERLSPGLWIGMALLTLLIFGGVVFSITHHLRSDIRERIVNRDGQTFTAVAQMLLNEASNNGDPEPADLFMTALQTSRLSGVLAVRLHDSDGLFKDAVPFDAQERPISSAQLNALRERQPLSYFEPGGELESIFELYIPSEDAARAPLLHVAIPLFNEMSRKLAGIAYYTLDGAQVAEEFRALDRSLALQAGTLFGLGGIFFLLAAGFAYRRLNRAHLLLRNRTKSLLEANQELSLAAKTSAIGAVTAHLIHGLKSPLAGLNQFVTAAGAGSSGPEEKEDWEAAGETTRRMQDMINEIVEILRDEDGAASYEVSLSELAEMITAKIGSRAKSAGVRYEPRVNHEPEINLPGYKANLIVLILTNLLDNALRVTEPGKQITLNIQGVGEETVFEVTDQGPGIPSEILENVFMPHKSGAGGGCGLGLAISHRLAHHIGAALEVKTTGPAGTVFRLSVPPFFLTIPLRGTKGEIER